MAMSFQADSAFENAKAHFFRGLALIEAEQWAQAEAELRQSLHWVPDRASSLTNLAAVLFKRSRYAEAQDLIGKALLIEPDNAEAALIQGILFHENKAYEQSLASFERAIALNPDFADAWANCGHSLKSLGRHEQALQRYEQALQRNYTLGTAIRGFMECYRHFRDYPRLFEIRDRHQAFVDNDYLATELLGYVFLEQGDKENAFDAFTRARIIAEKARQENNRTEWPLLPLRLRHDFEQLQYLDARGDGGASVAQALSVLRARTGGTPPPSTPAADDALLQAVSHYHHVPDLPFAATALGGNDYAQIERTFLDNALHLVVIDNFLSPQALSSLRKFCLEATVWKRTYRDGYLGSFMGTGLCPRVLLAIADELRHAMPNVIGANALNQAWAFKYDQDMKGTNLHADFARINTNFWITPDDACLDNTTGGLLVYDAPAPSDWGFFAYNSDQKKIRDYLESKQSKFVRVPYRCNRCVLFDSTYFHATDELHFKDGYANRRINCTLLYGKGL